MRSKWSPSRTDQGADALVDIWSWYKAYHGEYSAFVHDVDSDGHADLLGEGSSWELVDGTYGGFVLFTTGGALGQLDIDDASKIAYVPCTPDRLLFPTPTPIGDVTGDGLPDVAIVGWNTEVDGAERGVLWIVSRLHEAQWVAGYVSRTTLSDAVIAGHANQYGYGDFLVTATGLGDLDGDGYEDLAVSTESSIHLFMGPVAGFLDLNDATLSLTGAEAGMPIGVFGIGSMAAGDLDEDGVADLVVGNPYPLGTEDGELRIYSGAGLLTVMGR